VLKSIHRIVWCVAVSAVLGLILPAVAEASGRGSHSGGAHGFSQGAAHGYHSTGHLVVHRATSAVVYHRGQSGQLSYNAYWRAATSPNQPNPNQNYNIYWQKMQAWQQYHQR
jgi:hypothetical protein